MNLYSTTFIRLLWSFTALALSYTALAEPVYQPPGANLTLGDVTHNGRIQSASGNPAAAAADNTRNPDIKLRGTVVSASAGIEYGNLDNIFDFYNDVTAAYEPSDPEAGDFPAQLPEGKQGIDIGLVWDSLAPDTQAAVEAVATEVATQLALLALIKEEGHAKAWVSADAPFVVSNQYLDGSWTFGVNWSGSAKAYSFVEAISFDRDVARQRLEDWLSMLPINRPTILPISDDIVLTGSPELNAILFEITNDSSIITKATRSTELQVGYSRHAWSSSKGSLFIGAEARAYLMDLSRTSVRYGDITDSEELFDAIRNSEFRHDTGMGVDIGALWVGKNYQLGAQVTNINEPSFYFPDVNLAPYESDGAIRFLETDQRYTIDRQLKLEASLFSKTRRWSAHLGYDVDPATDPMGDRFQWLTVSGNLTTDKWWLPGARIGYRQNLTGTELGYASIGVTALKFLNIDIASALDTVKIDDTTLPQGLMFSMGFQITW